MFESDRLVPSACTSHSNDTLPVSSPLLLSGSPLASVGNPRGRGDPAGRHTVYRRVLDSAILGGLLKERDVVVRHGCVPLNHLEGAQTQDEILAVVLGYARGLRNDELIFARIGSVARHGVDDGDGKQSRQTHRSTVESPGNPQCQCVPNPP